MGKYELKRGERYFLAPKSEEEAEELIEVIQHIGTVDGRYSDIILRHWDSGFVISNLVLFHSPDPCQPGFFLQCDEFIRQFKKRETITIDGQVYYKDEVDVVLRSVNPLGGQRHVW